MTNFATALFKISGIQAGGLEFKSIFAKECQRRGPRSLFCLPKDQTSTDSPRAA
jgi:hypothetical protein